MKKQQPPDGAEEYTKYSTSLKGKDGSRQQDVALPSSGLKIQAPVALSMKCCCQEQISTSPLAGRPQKHTADIMWRHCSSTASPGAPHSSKTLFINTLSMARSRIGDKHKLLCFSPLSGKATLIFQVHGELLVLWSVKNRPENRWGNVLPAERLSVAICPWQMSSSLPHQREGGARGRGRTGKSELGLSVAAGGSEAKSCSSPRAALPWNLLQMRLTGAQQHFQREFSCSVTQLWLFRVVSGSLGGKGAASLYYRALHAGSAPSLESFSFKSPFLAAFSHRELLYVES